MTWAELGMEQFVHEQNLAHYRKLLAGTAHESKRQQILILLAEEESKYQPTTRTPLTVA